MKARVTIERARVRAKGLVWDISQHDIRIASETREGNERPRDSRASRPLIDTFVGSTSLHLACANHCPAILEIALSFEAFCKTVPHILNKERPACVFSLYKVSGFLSKLLQNARRVARDASERRTSWAPERAPRSRPLCAKPSPPWDSPPCEHTPSLHSCVIFYKRQRLPFQEKRASRLETSDAYEERRLETSLSHASPSAHVLADTSPSCTTTWSA